LTNHYRYWHLLLVMSITIQLDLPDALAKEAKANGLLESDSMTDLLSIELRRRKAAAELDEVLDKIHAQPGEPMSPEEIQAEIDAVRAERRARETGR
jgi:hypothetical protein